MALEPWQIKLIERVRKLVDLDPDYHVPDRKIVEMIEQSVGNNREFFRGYFDVVKIQNNWSIKKINNKQVSVVHHGCRGPGSNCSKFLSFSHKKPGEKNYSRYGHCTHSPPEKIMFQFQLLCS